MCLRGGGKPYFGNKCCKSMYFGINFSLLSVSHCHLQFVGEPFIKLSSNSSKNRFFVLIYHVPSIFRAVTSCT